MLTAVYSSVSAGDFHSLAIHNGYVSAWGYSKFGQCEVPNDLKDVIAVSAGGHHSLALRRMVR